MASGEKCPDRAEGQGQGQKPGLGFFSVTGKSQVDQRLPPHLGRAEGHWDTQQEGTRYLFLPTSTVRGFYTVQHPPPDTHGLIYAHAHTLPMKIHLHTHTLPSQVHTLPHHSHKHTIHMHTQLPTHTCTPTRLEQTDAAPGCSLCNGSSCRA